MDNKHSKSVPADVVAQILDLVKQASDLLLPYVTPLTPDQRKKLPKMGDKTFSFVEKSHEFAVQNPNLRPPFLDMAAFDADFADTHHLLVLNNATLQLHELTDDTAMVAGSESYQTSLVFYNSVKMAVRQDIPGAKAVYEELRKRFANVRRKSTGEEAENDD
ncbi:MAG: hypothetical protein LBH80_05780 [Prevotellaceae bacterium]|jgi:hypothetical protein|nr:hypothetical protein [Prevotellaceae bacterium]